MMESTEVQEAIQVLAQELSNARRGMPVKIVYSVSGVYMNLVSSCFIHKPDLFGDAEGLIVPVDLSPRVLQTAAYIREKCYVPDKGTWYSMSFTINADNTAEITLNFDDEPLYHEESLSSELYILDQAKFPVDEANQSDWLKSKLNSIE